MSNDVSLGDDMIDSRDLIARIDELKEERDAAARCQQCDQDMILTETEVAHHVTEDGEIDHDADADHTAYAGEFWDEDELSELEALADEASDYAADWTYGTTLVADHYTEQYAIDYATDVSGVSRDLSWPFTHIDWKAATDELFSDGWTEVTVAGWTYYVQES